VLWSSLVDDPSEYMPDEDPANQERERLFKILEDLMLWENVNYEDVLDKARLEIARSVARDLHPRTLLPQGLLLPSHRTPGRCTSHFRL
jgi:hypothetical protein